MNNNNHITEIINSTIEGFMNENAHNTDLILYHGTKNKFDDFDLRFFNSATADGGWLGFGIYLTNDYEYAESYGDVLECKVYIENPYILTDPLYSRRPVKLKNELNVNTAKEITTKLKNNNYDSVLLKYPDDNFWMNEFIELNVFNPTNIKIINRFQQWDTSPEIKQKKGYK